MSFDTALMLARIVVILLLVGCLVYILLDFGGSVMVVHFIILSGLMIYLSWNIVGLGLAHMYDMKMVQVVTYEDDGYTDIIVPIEDKELVMSKEKSINELREMYNTEYTGDRYIEAEDAFEVKADMSVNYELKLVEE